MNRPARGILGLSLLVCMTAASAQDFLPPASLAQAAIAARAEVRAAQARVVEARAHAAALAAGPHDATFALAPLRRTVRDAPTASGRARYDEWDVQLTRTFRLPGKAALDRESGEHAVAAAQLLHGEAEHQAALALLDDWLGWLRADAGAKAALARSDSLQREHAMLARRVALGDAAQRELDQIGAELAGTQAELRQAQAQLEASRVALYADFGQLPLPARAPELPDPVPLEETPQAWVDHIIARSHEIRVAEELYSAQDALARRANADRLPDPTVGVQTFSERGGMERGIGLVLEVPFGARRRSAQASAASASADALYAQAQASRRDIGRDAQLRVNQVQASLSVWQAARAARTANEHSYARQRRAWELGEIGLAERLQAERLSAAAAGAELRARADAHEARLRMLIDAHALWHEPDAIENHQAH